MQQTHVLNDGGNSRKLVIAADDAPDILFLLGGALRNAGFNFMGTGSGLELLALSLRVVPRLILLDIEMPAMNGFETCRRLRANRDLARVPIAFLTARKAFEDVTEGLSAGGNDFLLKPIRPAHLIDRAQHWTSRHIGA